MTPSNSNNKYMIRSTPQTLTLGAGGDDDDDDFVELQEQPAQTRVSSSSSYWLPQRFLTAVATRRPPPQSSSASSPHSEYDDTTKSRRRYMQVELQEQRRQDLAASSSSSSSLDQSLLGTAAADSSLPLPLSTMCLSSAPLSADGGILGSMASRITGSSMDGDGHDDDTSMAAPLSSSSLNATKLQQDCSFFYRSMDTTSQSQQKRQRSSSTTRFRTVLHDSYQHIFHYRDAVDVLSPPVLNHYRARYQQLNQPLEFASASSMETNIVANATERGGGGAEHFDYDLQLHDDKDPTRTTLPKSYDTNNSSVQRSSLLYKHHGRILLKKLPQDHVRLLMDADLPVGKLSVCQWRQPQQQQGDHDDDDDDVEAAAAPTGDSASRHSRRHRPSLHYVLTVPDDLYRKVVADMSQDSYYYIGVNDKHDHVGIGVAVCIVTVVMVVMLVVGAAFGDS